MIHGKNAYADHKCRCEVCVKAWRNYQKTHKRDAEYWRAYRARRRDAGRTVTKAPEPSGAVYGSTGCQVLLPAGCACVEVVAGERYYVPQPSCPIHSC